MKDLENLKELVKNINLEEEDKKIEELRGGEPVRYPGCDDRVHER